MENKNLEEKIGFLGAVKSSLRKHAGLYLTAAALALGTAAYGCGGPSEECCWEISCPSVLISGESKICDGDGDSCYCRDKNCCEIRDCPGGPQRCVEGTDEYGINSCFCSTISDKY